jgi:hypothetical protein
MKNIRGAARTFTSKVLVGDDSATPRIKTLYREDAAGQVIPIITPHP